MLRRQLHGVLDHLERCRLGVLLVHRHFRVLVENHGIGPVEEVVPVLRRYSAEFQDSQQRQLRSHLLDKFALAATGHAIDDVLRMLPKTRLVGVDSARREHGPDNAARFELARRVHVDGHVTVDHRHFILGEFLGHRAARFRGEQLRVLRDEIDFVAPGDQPIGHAVYRVLHPVHGPRFPNPSQLLIGHSLRIGIGIDQILKLRKRALTHAGTSGNT